MSAAQLFTLRFCVADVHSTTSEKWEGNSQWHFVGSGAELEEPTSPERICGDLVPALDHSQDIYASG
jgi:hypothetical protein